jgi:hypothetical protein
MSEQCEFYEEARHKCVVRQIIEDYGKSTFNVRRLPNGHKDKFCATKKHRFCSRRYKLHSIIKRGDYEG